LRNSVSAVFDAYNSQLGDPKSAMADENHVDHKRVVEDRDRLYKIAYPGGTA